MLIFINYLIYNYFHLTIDLAVCEKTLWYERKIVLTEPTNSFIIPANQGVVIEGDFDVSPNGTVTINVLDRIDPTGKNFDNRKT